MIDFTTALDTKDDDLEVVGGKGRSLACMARAGFSVPGGFQVTTAAYLSYVSDNDLAERILELARPEIAERGISFEKDVRRYPPAVRRALARRRDRRGDP